MTLAEAIAKFEGYGASGTNLPTRNNNPGDIQYGSFAASYGATPDPNSSFAIFPDAATGFNAITGLLATPSYSGLSIAQAIARWNGNGSNTQAYVDYVTSQTGLSADSPVSSLVTGTPISLMAPYNETQGQSFDWSSYFGSSGSDLDNSITDNSSIWTWAVIAGIGIFVIWYLE